MVDGQFAPLHDKIKAAIATISPCRSNIWLILTFTAITPAAMQLSNEALPSSRGVRVRLAAGTVNALTGVKTPPVAPEALPKETYIGGGMTPEAGGRKLR
jgi:hypothetical protein